MRVFYVSLLTKQHNPHVGGIYGVLIHNILGVLSGVILMVGLFGERRDIKK